VSLGPKPLWARPKEGALKLNIDGAYVKETGQAGAGMIMRRADGSVVFSACWVLRHCSSAFEAELVACLEGIRFAADMDLSHITIESDCQTLVFSPVLPLSPCSPHLFLLSSLCLAMAGAHPRSCGGDPCW
jgi:hypothetical protein